MDFQKRYEFDPKIDLLGSGVFSRIYKAKDILLQRTVALKFFTAEASAKYQILDKIQKALKIQHQNLCKFYDVELLSTKNILGETENVVVAVMEYLERGDFENHIKIHPAHTDKLFVDILKGLSYLHKHGMVYGDLRPQNILVSIEDDEPVAKIIDYGITKLSDPTNHSSTAVMSTIEYMPPEHFNPKRYGMGGQITTNLDLWSFGLIVYETVTNTKLFGSVSTGTSEGEVMSNILYKFPLAQFNQLPRKYKEIVNKCIVKDASERVQHASEIIRVFEKYTDVKSPVTAETNEKKPGSNGHQISPEPGRQDESRSPQNGLGAVTNKRIPDDKFLSANRKGIEEKQGSVSRPIPVTSNRKVPEDIIPAEKPVTSSRIVSTEKPVTIIRIEPQEQSFSTNRFGVTDKSDPDTKDLKSVNEGAYFIPPKENRPDSERSPVREQGAFKPAVSKIIDPPLVEKQPIKDPHRPRPTRPPLAPLNRPSNKKIQIQKQKRRKIFLFIFLALVIIAGFFFLEKVLFPPVAKPNKSANGAAPNAIFEAPDMVLIEGGSYLMGSSDIDAQENEKPAHNVILGSFLMGKYELTVREFSHFITETRYQTTSDSLGFSWIYKQGEWVKGENVNWTNDIYGKMIEVKDMDVPVIHISWVDAMNYCKWLSGVTRLAFRLPTEAEWEFAARGGNNSKSYRFSGSDSISQVAWFKENSGENLAKVGQKLPNELGIYDMSGNVMEWCYDFYDDQYYSSAIPENSFGPDSGTEKVARGGSWFTQDLMCRSTFRMAYPESTRGGNIGFRICRSAQ